MDQGLEGVDTKGEMDLGKKGQHGTGTERWGWDSG